MTYNVLTKSAIDMVETATVSQFFTDFLQQVIVAVAIVLINTLLYPLLKYFLNKIYKKFGINADTQKEVNDIVDKSQEEINDKLKEKEGKDDE